MSVRVVQYAALTVCSYRIVFVAFGLPAMLDKPTRDPAISAVDQADLTYMPGFGNDFETESLPGALPQGQNSPQKCAYGLYAEQLSGSPFTAPRGTNERSWLYRIRPSVKHNGRFAALDRPHWKTAPCLNDHSLALGQLRWDPVPMPKDAVDFISGMRTITTAGDAMTQTGMASHVYVCNADMVDDYFFNADGEMLIVPETGTLRIFTELGIMDVAPLEIALIPRGMLFKVSMQEAGVDGGARGYVCENYGAKFTLPTVGRLGPTALPIRVISKHPLRPMRTRKHHVEFW